MLRKSIKCYKTKGGEINPLVFLKNPDKYTGFVYTVKMDTVPVIRNGRVFLAARYIAEEFGYDVQWKEPKLYFWHKN